MRLIVSIAALAISFSPALADRQVTEDERAKGGHVLAESILLSNTRLGLRS